jgi:FtsH-binding integral membrane protein
VPLSEDEQRILSEIEQQLYETDPALARDIADTTIYTHAYRNLKWAILGFIAGVVALWFSLGTSYLLAFGCFIVMLVCALAIERSARKMGKAGLQQITTTMKASGFRDALGNANQRMRDRFKRDE